MLLCGLLGAAGPAQSCQEASIVLYAGCRSVSGRTSLGPSVPGLLLIALSLPWWERRLEVLGALVPMSLPCFFLWLEFGVVAGPDPRSLDHSGRGALCPAALYKALKSTPAMLHILALYAELATFVLPPNSIPERQRSLQQFQDLRRLFAWEEFLLLLPMCRV